MKNAKHREELHQQLNSAIQSGIIANVNILSKTQA